MLIKLIYTNNFFDQTKINYIFLMNIRYVDPIIKINLKRKEAQTRTQYSV